MAERHPYSPSPGHITAAINHFRNSFPATVNADTLKQLGIATKNESYVINVLRFIGAIDKEGKQTDEAATVFSQHDDADFQKGFEQLVKVAYADLFALHKDNSWTVSSDKLISFFRTTDKTTAIVGRLQAATFQLLAGFAGHGSVPELGAPKIAKAAAAKPKAAKSLTGNGGSGSGNGPSKDIGLTVRIEVNLPPAADQETYDRIFRSIRENLLNGK